jgi:hypothetical protein
MGDGLRQPERAADCEDDVADRIASERPNRMTGSPVRSTFSSARSVSGSRPTTVAGRERPSLSSTEIWSALAIRWWFVTICPPESMITPDPRLRCSRSR